jgi:hypothetical protein
MLVRNGKAVYESQWMFIFFAIAAKKTNQKKRLVKPHASTLSACSYAFLDAPHHRKS